MIVAYLFIKMRLIKTVCPRTGKEGTQFKYLRSKFLKPSDTPVREGTLAVGVGIIFELL